MTTEKQHYVNGTDVTTRSEMVTRPERRKFSKTYKRQIVKEAAKCSHGETGAMLRREGLYSSQLIKWRREEAKGELSGTSRAKGTGKGKVLATEMAALQEENGRLSRMVEQAELIIDAQKKLSLALEQTLTAPKGKN